MSPDCRLTFLDGSPVLPSDHQSALDSGVRRNDACKRSEGRLDLLLIQLRIHGNGGVEQP